MSIFGKLFALDFGGPRQLSHKGFRQDHIRQGLYVKLFHSSRISFIKKINRELDNDISNLREHVLDFNRKIQLVHAFLTTKDIVHLKGIKDEVKDILKIVTKEYDLDKKEDKYVIKAVKSITKVLNQETNEKMWEEEKDIRLELNELRNDIEKLQPILERQITYLKKPISDQLHNLKQLFSDINDEARIIGYEENLLGKIKKLIDRLEIDAILVDE